MRKFAVFLASVMLMCMLVGCEHNVPSRRGDSPVVPPRNDPFTVRLTYEDKPYHPTVTIRAYWTDKYTGRSASAVFNSEGVASIEGLDGEYTVSVASLPSEFTYNANIYEADNERRDVTVRMLKVYVFTGKGTDFYGGAIQFADETLQDAAYRLRFDQAGQRYYTRFQPKRAGKFVIQSIADIYADEVNPRLEYYQGSVAWMPSAPTKVIDYDERDPESTRGIYTKNFVFRVQMHADGIGGVFGFIIKCDNRGKWPAYVDFTLTRYDNATVVEKEYNLVLPQEKFTNDDGTPRAPVPDVGSFRPLATASPYKDASGRTRYKFDSSLVWYADPTKQYDVLGGKGDGYYHMMRDGEKTADVVYALFTRAAIGGVFESFYNANLKIGSKDYTFFVRGYQGLVNAGHPQAGDFIDRKSYCDYLNSYGGYPVTAELRGFLNDFAAARRYFYDGEGSAEHAGYDAADGETWMFACGYYS